MPHKGICPLLKKWRKAAKGKVTAEAAGHIKIPDLSEETYDDLEMTVLCDEETDAKRPLKAETSRERAESGPREAKSDPGTILKTSGGHLGLSWASKTPHICPKMGGRAAKRRPRAFKRAPRAPKKGQERPPDARKRVQRSPRAAKIHQGVSNRHHEA